MLRLLFDTNVHSDWADASPRLAHSLQGRLSRILCHANVELILPFSSFMEFRWPADKQKRWIASVFTPANCVSALMGDPIALDVAAFGLETLGQTAPALPVRRLSAADVAEAFAVLRASPEAATMQQALAVRAGAEQIGKAARRRPANISKAEYRDQERIVRQQAASLLAEPGALRQAMQHVQSPEHEAVLRRELEQVVPELRAAGVELDVDEIIGANRMIYALLDAPEEQIVAAGVNPAALVAARAYREWADNHQPSDLEAQARYVAFRSLTPHQMPGDLATCLFNQAEKQRHRLPSFYTYMHIVERIERQVARRAHPSDFHDARIIACLPHVDYMTTDAEMKSLYGDAPLYGVGGRLFARQELPELLSVIEARLA